MPKCQTCTKFLGPNFCIIINEETDEKQCVFCYLEKDEITIENDDGSERKITKEEAMRKYQEYLKDLYHSEKVQEIVNPESKSNIIKPY